MLDPGFSAIYRPRVTFRKFVAHANERGTKFVDSYAGTSLGRSLTLIALALAPLALVAGLIWAIVVGNWPIAVTIFVAVLAGISAPAVIAARYASSPRSILSYFTYIIPFAVAFWPGLVRGIVMHRKAFTDRSRHAEESRV